MCESYSARTGCFRARTSHVNAINVNEIFSTTSHFQRQLDKTVYITIDRPTETKIVPVLFRPRVFCFNMGFNQRQFVVARVVSMCVCVSLARKFVHVIYYFISLSLPILFCPAYLFYFGCIYNCRWIFFSYSMGCVFVWCRVLWIVRGDFR